MNNFVSEYAFQQVAEHVRCEFYVYFSDWVISSGPSGARITGMFFNQSYISCESGSKKLSAITYLLKWTETSVEEFRCWVWVKPLILSVLLKLSIHSQSAGSRRHIMYYVLLSEGSSFV